ncbi:MAG TPA: hypothetical protein VKB19_02915 [Pedobacter sp.]|nr:hypothetical protein [Pedobacter sp.]
MKNAFKYGFLALAVSISVVACDPSGKTGSDADSTAIDSTVIAAPDSAVIDTVAIDTATTDTTTKI